MPCWTIQTSQVEWNANTNLDLLEAALLKAGYQVRRQGDRVHFSKYGLQGVFENDQMTVQGTDSFDGNVLKRAYSAEVVQTAAKRFGWQLKSQKQNKFEFQRRF